MPNSSPPSTSITIEITGTVNVSAGTERHRNPYLATEILTVIERQAKADPNSVEAKLRPSLKGPIADYLACGAFADSAAIRRSIATLAQIHPWILKSNKYEANFETQNTKRK